MNRTFRALTSAAAVIVVLLASVVPARADLSAIRALYASAAYEEALTQLKAAADAGEDPVQVEQYRALCQIALGRLSDAEQSVERLVARNPLYRIQDRDVSPRLVAMFGDVRKRMLPATAKERYARAKASYDSGNFAAAAADFRMMLQLVADLDPGESGMSDLKQLGEGFLKLAEASLTPPAPKPAPAPKPEAAEQNAAATPPSTPSAQPPAPVKANPNVPPPPSPNAATTDPATAKPRPAPPVTPPPAAPTDRTAAGARSNAEPALFSVDDSDVTPPAEISAVLPRYQPPSGFSQLVFRGTLVVIVDEEGRVESVELVKPVSATYDATLLKAARQWRFKPATRNGRPVRYRKLFEIVLRPAA
jgi:protein TonB